MIRNACDIALRNGSINKEVHGMLVEILGNVNMRSSTVSMPRRAKASAFFGPTPFSVVMLS